ncbi:MAG TPA: glycyl-radical enzyme activating protein [Clostridiaceae bacterium]
MEVQKSEVKGRIFDIKFFAIHDGPGIRTTIFLKGCPLKCIWCHNPEGISPKEEIAYITKKCVGCGVCFKVCPNGVYGVSEAGTRIFQRDKCKMCLSCIDSCYPQALMLYGKEVTVAEVMEKVLQDSDFYKTSNGGITLSGGEPLTQAEFSAELLKGCIDKGIHTAVDTCGYVRWESFEAVLPYTKMFLYDFKHIDDEAHIKYTGVSNQLIIENLVKLGSRGVPIEIRIPVIPGINDNAEYAKRTGELLGRIPAITAVRLLKYHNLAKSKYISLGKPERMPETSDNQSAKIDEYASFLEQYGLKVFNPNKEEL